MKYYRIDVSTDVKEIGVFPQRRDLISKLQIDDSNHLFKQPGFTILKPDIYIPSFRLHSKAKITDVISLPINNDWIISNRLKEIFESEKIQNFQFVPISLYRNDKHLEYFILRSLLPQMDCVDYPKTEVVLKEVFNEHEEKFNVPDYNAFKVLELKTNYPNYLEFKHFSIRTDFNIKFFTLKYTYGLNTHFISEDLKNILIKNFITGIRYLEVDEVL